MLKHILVAAALATTPALVAPALACDGEEKVHTATIGTLDVNQLASKLDAAQKKKATIAIFDANSDETRAQKGIIPTAVLLPSSSDYDVALLPKDKSGEVVFYCAAEKCSASKTAAKRAVAAGYTNVNVLPEGIAGWLKAGKATQKVSIRTEQTEPPKVDVKVDGKADTKVLPAQG